MNKNRVVLSLLMLAVLGLFAALELRSRPDSSVDRAMQTQVIDALVAKLHAHYIFPDKARQIEALLRKRQKEGRYDRITSGFDLAGRLSADLHLVARDRHMKVWFQPGMDLPAGGPPSASLAEREYPGFAERLVLRYSAGRAVKRVDRLSHNIGYLKITGFPDAHLMTDKFAAAMNELADTDGLIVDLSPNAGGDPASVALLISYFVDQPTRLNDMFDRDTGKTTQHWTRERLDGKRYGGKKPVAILVGPRTASAGEDFAYTMQALKRATVVGKPTWGGAHPVTSHAIGGYFVAQIPGARSISPITGTNWEGVGVIPDVDAERVRALTVAHGLLRGQLQGRAPLAAVTP